MEGGLTCLISVAGVYLIPDFPDTPVSWLTREEQILAQHRMIEDLCGIEQKRTQKSGFVEAFTDWKVWWLAIVRFLITVGQSFGNFFPILAATIGYNPSTTLLLCAPPWILGTATSFYVSQFVICTVGRSFHCSLKPPFRHSDATRDRFWHITGLLCVGIIGFSLGILTMNIAVRYLSLWVDECFYYTCVWYTW